MIDARGYACPLPVVMVQKEVKKTAPSELTVLVDNVCAVENVTRFANNNGYDAATSKDGEDFVLTLRKK